MRKNIMNRHRLIGIGLSFSVILLFLLFSSPWYASSKLQLQGTCQQAGTTLQVQWDSGHGLNDQEKQEFVLGRPTPDADGLFHITLSRIAIDKETSFGSQVICSKIELDGKPYTVPEQVIKGQATREGDLLHFDREDSVLHLALRANSHIRLEFLTFNFAGKVKLEAGGWEKLYELYTPNDLSHWGRENVKRIDFWPIAPDGRFEVVTDLPRYAVKRLQMTTKGHGSILLTDAVLLNESGEKQNLVFSEQGEETYSLLSYTSLVRRFFHPIRFLQQIIYALLLTWLGSELVSRYRIYGNWRSFLTSDQRIIFFCFSGVASIIFFLWQLAFWPAVMSIDSLKVWRAAGIPGMFLGDHPPLNIIFYHFLSQLWDNPGVVPLTHNILFSLLVAGVFFFCYRRQVSLKLLIPCYLLVVSSLPIGLYNVILWKDIPFAILMNFWAFSFVMLFSQKKQGVLDISVRQWLIYGGLGIMLPLFRYNGVVSLAVLPLFFLFLGIVKIPRRLSLFLLIAVVLGTVAFSSSKPIRNFITSRTYFVTQGIQYVSKMKDAFSTQFLRNKKDDYFSVFDVNQKKTNWDHVHYFLHDRYNYPFLKRVGWNDIYPYLPDDPPFKTLRRWAMKAYALSYQEPWVYLSWNPVYLLALFPITVVLFRLLPLSAIFSSFILIQMAALLLIAQVMNWRYYYFAYLGGYLLLPILCLDLRRVVESIQRKRHAV